MRKSLTGSFEASADAGRGAPAAAPCLSKDELKAMLDFSLRLAAENKITDRNVWSLPLIDHLPDMVQRAAPDDREGGEGGGNYFTRISGGLDAGVQIFARRVDATWKLAYAQLHGAPQVDGAEDGSQDADGSQQPGAAEAKRRRRGGAQPQEEDTLADAEQLRMKQLDGSFMVDPLFHHMSQIFDEDGAAGMLLLNRGVYRGSSIMFESGEVPEDQFPLEEAGPGAGAAVEDDAAVNLAQLRPLLQLLRQQQESAAARPGTCAAIAPAMRGLYALVGQAAPETIVDEAEVEAEVANIMEALEGDCVRFPAAGHGGSGGVGHHASFVGSHVRSAAEPAVAACASGADPAAAVAADAAGAGHDGDEPMGSDFDCAGSAGWDGGSDGASDADMADGGPADAETGEARAEMQEDAAAAAQAAEAAVLASQRQEQAQRDEADLCARLAEQYAQGDDGVGDAGYAGVDESWANGGDEDGGSSDGEGAEEGGARRPGAAPALADLLGGEGLDSVPWLLGLGGAPAAGVTRGAGWAGSGYWRYQKGAAAGTGAAAKKGAATKRSAKRSSDTFVDFENPPPIPAGALARGTAKQTCLATCTAANTLLPEDLRYEVASLGRLFFKPRTALVRRRRSGGDDGLQQQQQLTDWSATDRGAAELYGPGDDGGDDGDDGGGFMDFGGGGGYDSDADAGGGPEPVDEGAGLDADQEHELLQAPRRVAQVGVTYSRASKQVDVHALKDIIWGGVLRAPPAGPESLAAARALDGGGEGTGAAAGEPGGGVVDFRDVIKVVPEQSPAGRLEDMSVHMCFICLLHLANQHGLEVKSGPDLRTLTIRGSGAAPSGEAA